MTGHEQVCFNDALHKLQVRDAELRIRRKLEAALNEINGMMAEDQLPYLHRLEGLFPAR